MLGGQALGADLAAGSSDLLGALERSVAALNVIAHTLENEFAERFGHTGANPLEIAKRLRKLQRELPVLKQECQAVLSCKQELVDSARRLLDANTASLQQLCSKAGFAPPDDEGVHAAYDGAVAEWEAQLGSRHAGRADAGAQHYSARSLNLALAQSRLQ